ncbi:MAG: DUF1653 domain-containing protein [Candidatus Saccharibacteria bacterium]|nr:DUF1653 domain-containing protein [Candidatus Saccharibacteria bacterium]
MGHKSPDELKEILEAAKAKVVIGSRYSHFKDENSIYEVIDVVISEATEEPLVIYKDENGAKLTFARPLSSWSETIEHDQEEVRRFTPMDII